MRKEYAKALRKLFAAAMKEAAPEFVEERVRSMYFFPGDRAYRWRASKDIHSWIVLSPSKKDYHEFTILIGWSKLGRYPELSMVPAADRPSATRQEFSMDEYLTRLPYLWTEDDEWWVIEKWSEALSVERLAASLEPVSPDTAEARVAPLVHDVIERLRTVGIPYLEEFVTAQR